MTARAHSITGIIMAIIGVLILLVEIGLHIWAVFTHQEYDLNHWVLIVGMVFGFVGFYIQDPKKTSEGATVLVQNGVEILKNLPLRLGRRSTDAVVVPDPDPTTTVVVTTPPPEDTDGGKGGKR